MSRSMRALSLCLLCLFVSLAACKSNVQPDRGIRPEFKGEQISAIVMTPFYSNSSMGYAEEERKELYARYEQSAQSRLEQLGFEVRPPAVFTQTLMEQDLWQLYQDGWVFRQALEDYFQGSISEVGVEVLTLRALREKGVFGEDAVLFGEVVYQSEMTCLVLADEQSPFAVVDHEPGVDVNAPGGSPCVVSHLHSVIVDPPSEKVMWANRGLVELHVAELSDAVVNLTIERVVELVYAGEQGLLALRDSAS